MEYIKIMENTQTETQTATETPAAPEPVVKSREHMPLREWIDNFLSGKYDAADTKTQCAAGWYDWFCRSTSLAKKTEFLGMKVVQLSKSPKVNLDTMYVFFKNNCPMAGRLYDDFRICSIETGDVIYTITPSCGHRSNLNHAEVWGRENDFAAPLVSGKWSDVKKFFFPK